MMKILAYQGKSFISKLIRWQTRSKYSHIAVELDDGTIVEAWASYGVIHNSFSYAHKPGTPVDVYRIKGLLDSVKAEEFLLEQVGKKYDWKSVFRFLWHTPASKNDKWFCSELAETALAKGSVELQRGNYSEHSPRDTAMSPLLEYEDQKVTPAKDGVAASNEKTDKLRMD